MSYLTWEVEIDHSRTVPAEPEKLPERGRGLFQPFIQHGLALA
jgi:hypothetical protein